MRVSSNGDPEPSRGSIFCMAITVPAVVTTPWKRKLIFPPLKEAMFALNDPPAIDDWMGLPKGSQTRARLSL